MIENSSKLFESVQEDIDEKKDVLSAAKEALVTIMNKFSIDVLLMTKAAGNLNTGIMRYPYSSKEQEISELKELAIHIVEETLSEKSMHVPDIMDAFTKELEDKLPSQKPLAA